MDKQRRDLMIKSGLSVLSSLFLGAHARSPELMLNHRYSKGVTHEMVTLEHFYALSTWVTYHNDLDNRYC